jgi:tetratricopeptide (TPR) repeat protein
MAKKLNKKVALIGTVVFLILFVMALVVIQQKDILTSQEKIIEDGDAARAEGDYETAATKYNRAKSRAKNDQTRLVAMDKLIDLYLETEDWPPLRGTWADILKIAPDNLSVRYAQLKNLYIIADNGFFQLWQDVEKQASDFLEIVEKEGLLDEDTAQWEKPQYQKVGLVHDLLSGADGVQRIGQYLYLLKGKAKLEMARRGAVTDPNALLEEAISDLEKAQDLDKTNTSVAWQLARAIIVKGDLLASRGSFEEQGRARQLALEILQKAVEDSPEDPQAYINHLSLQRDIAMSEESTLENLKTFEPKYKQLAEKFPNKADVHSLLSIYYRVLGAEYLDQAIAEIEKARQLEPNNVFYAVAAADTYNIKAAIKNDNSALEKAVSILNDATRLPNVQDTEGPQQYRQKNNRATVYHYLGTIYIERLLDPAVSLSPEQRQQWLEKVEDIVHEIEQIRGSGEDPVVIKWQGMLALAKGQRTEAIQELYAVYQRLEASKNMDTQLAYVLAKAFENTNEIGAETQFFMSALRLRPEDRNNRGDRIDRRKPSAILDLAGIMLRLRDAQSALMFINYFENVYGENSRSHILKINAFSAAGNFEDAEDALAQGGIDSSEQLKLETQMILMKIAAERAKLNRQFIAEDINVPGETPDVNTEPVNVEQVNEQIRVYNDRLAQLIGQLVNIEPNSVNVSTLLSVCKTYYVQGENDKARELASLYLQKFPENILVQSYLKALDTNQEITDKLLTEIRMQVIENISDPIERAFNLGLAYAQQNEPNEAAVQFGKVLDVFEAKTAQAQADVNDELSRRADIAGSFLFENALRIKQWDVAEELIDVARRYDIDQFNGDYFEARYRNAIGENEKALQAMERCAKLRPVSSQVLLLRGQIKEALGRTHEAITDMKRALLFDPLSGNISRSLALALYRRNLALEGNVTTDQFIETKEAIQMAVGRNPADTQLRSFYAEFISDSDPDSALSIRQSLLRSSPSVNNAVLLGNLAFKISDSKTNEDEKQALLEIASNSYKKALELDPGSPVALTAYAQFCRNTGRPNEAEKVISGSMDERIQWRYYLNSGQYDKARTILERIYADKPENEQVLIGLLSIARATLNPEDAKKYSQALCEVNDSVENNLIQVRTYLTLGMVDEAQSRLESFREKHPDDSTGQLYYAWLLSRKGKLDEALEMVNKTLEYDQNNSRAWLLRGEINRLLGDPGQAISDLVKSRSINDTPDTRVALAQAYMAANRAADAITELEAIVDEPSTPEQARLLLESIFELTGNKNLLASYYSKMMNQYPDNMIWVLKAAIFSEGLKNFGVAQRLYLRAWDMGLEKGSPDISALDGYIKSLINDNKLQEALDVCAKYVDSEFASIALVNMAIVKAKMGNKTAAVENFRAAADLEQNDQISLSRILYAMYDMMGSAEVEKYCDQKLADNPDSLVFNYVLYSLSNRSGDYNKALGFINKCLDMTQPDSADYINALFEKGALLSRAYLKYSDNSYFEQAIATWQQFLKARPNNPGVLNNLAYLLADNNKELPLALEYAQKAVEISPDNPEIRDTYAYVLYKNSRFDEALENVRATIQQFEVQQGSAPAEVYEHLGMILDALGQSTEAIRAFEKALDFGGDTLPQANKDRINQALQRLRGF